MKTPKEWLICLISSENMHDAACRCDRCKNGYETFLLESDIKAIQDEAFKAGMREAAKAVNSRTAYCDILKRLELLVSRELTDPQVKARIEAGVRKEMGEA